MYSRSRSGMQDLKNKSQVPIGSNSIQQQLPVRHIKLKLPHTTMEVESQIQYPAYLQNPNAPIFHPSRDPATRTKMVDNLS